ncbi:MAG TPA: LysM peptidoglycan-binding domain-containing protein [Clostridiales bacterium]|nr:LysM peptidoglycan-binding domain-containing protein [Clostridiales bacterium]HPK35712.1 LysM peptidoglycan-binding domain-containing protein [Oscillospiraceae bacterium]HPR75080.1 LysM peptidoglycan-binding domain-containing protein [Oscillospiraceae bacterium]
MVIYVVKPGDSIYSISQIYGVSSAAIIQANGLTNPDRLVIGQALVIPLPSTYTVKSGDSLYSISRMFGITLTALQQANPQITNPARINIGQVINIPPQPKLGTIDVNGYAFPNINMELLQSVLPDLTYLSIFNYEVKPDGSLSTINDTPLIQAARAGGVAPMMVITNIEEGGGFSSELGSTILNNQAVQDTLLNNVVQTLQSKNYYGLDIDFEFIYPSDREAYNAFLRKTAALLKPMGYTLTTAVAPKVSASQPGLLYEAHDYPVHGEVADHVIIMTYEWGYTYGPARAVAPLDQVRRVIQYAVTAIPSQKILMGIPNYGYDWTLPFVQGSAARTLSNVEAVEQAARVGANIEFDITAQSPYYYYYSGGKRHAVWFEDARSIRAKLLLVNQYNLGGISYWTINRPFPQNWSYLGARYNTRKLL